MQRAGILPLARDENGAYIPPTKDTRERPAETRAARRKYRKMWRRDIARDVRDFEKAAKRVQKRMRWQGAIVKGHWSSREDPLDGMLLKIKALEVGRRPRKNARAGRWQRVRNCPELRRVLKEVAIEFGLIKRYDT